MATTEKQKRIRIEKRIAKKCIECLLEEGYRVSVHDGEAVALNKSRSAKDIIKAMMSTDEDTLLVFHPVTMEQVGMVYFVYGNDGHDVINDNSCSLEEILGPVTKLADEIAEAC